MEFRWFGIPILLTNFMASGKILLLVILLLLGFLWVFSTGLVKWPRTTSLTRTEKKFELDRNYLLKLHSRANLARQFTKQKGYNETICFLIDMSLPSGQSRFFVYNMKKDTLQNSGLVTHGRCNQEWLEGRKYGNTVGCGCTSLGKYRVGKSYQGKFGLAFKLHGLEKTNDKAYERFVVLHAHDCVPETENGDEICQSDGCPTVAPGFLQQLNPMIKKSPKPVLLWIFE